MSMGGITLIVFFCIVLLLVVFLVEILGLIWRIGTGCFFLRNIDREYPPFGRWKETHVGSIISALIQ